MLRQRTGTNAGKWRVTVRQLESLIRLSEAMAKLECSDEVIVKHVKEAKRLLSKSIVTVEQPDIDLEEDENEHLDVDMNEAPPLMAALNAIDNNEMETPPRKLFFFFYILHKNIKNSDSYLFLVLGILLIESQEVAKKKLTMSFEEYKNLSNMLVLYMRNEEIRAETEPSGMFIEII